MYVYTYIWVYIFRIFISRKTRCAYYFKKCGSVTAVSWNCNTSHPSKVVSLLWPQQTEDGCHLSMWNTLFKPLRSYSAMTRFRAYQTLIYIMWALCYPFFQNSEKCIDSISSHCAINDWMNYVKIFRRLNQLYFDCLKNDQCNMTASSATL